MNVRYSKFRGDWQYQINFLKLFIEFKSDLVDLFQNDNTINNFGENNIFDVLIRNNGTGKSNSKSDDMSLDNDSERDDNE